MTREELAGLLALQRPKAAPAARTSSTLERNFFCIEALELDLGHDRPVRGWLTRPLDNSRQLPAVLYCHAHGARYDIGADELMDGRSSLLSPYGPALAREGFITLCIDMPTFGQRRQPDESALSKALLWHGRTLMGAMLSDLLGAFDYLAERRDVDDNRIAALGLSMGATHAYFLGALEPRFARIAHLCCYADWAYLVETGAHDLHGHYMTVPGLLAKTSIGGIAGLIAPRPQLVCVGYKDPLTPRPAVELALAETLSAYAQLGAATEARLVSDENTGHIETPRMRAAVLEFLGGMNR